MNQSTYDDKFDGMLQRQIDDLKQQLAESQAREAGFLKLIDATKNYRNSMDACENHAMQYDCFLSLEEAIDELLAAELGRESSV